MKKKILSILLAVVMIAGMLPLGAITAFAEEGVKYLEYNTSTGAFEEHTCTDYTTVPGVKELFMTAEWTEEWYVAPVGELELGPVIVSGNVNLILPDGCVLRVHEGIRVCRGNSLTIYAGANGAGQLFAKGSASAGIGGGGPEVAGDITIHGGNIEATGGRFAAGIGGNYYGNAGTVTIYGGRITAYGDSEGGAGIGGAYKGAGGTVNIYGGTIAANGGDNGAGIGGGCESTGGTVNIYGGNINAVGGPNAAGIGGGLDTNGADVHISGGSIIATGSEGCKAIGCGISEQPDLMDDGDIYSENNAVLHNRRDDSIIYGVWLEPDGKEGHWSYISSVNGTAIEDEQGRKTVSFYAISDISSRTEYLAYNTSTNTIEKKSIDESMTCGIYGSTTWDQPWYEVDGNVTIDGTVIVKGDVNLILNDYCKLEVKGGISVNVGNSLTIYAQSDGDNKGELISEGAAGEMGDLSVAGSAGIGGCEYENGVVRNVDTAGDITIHGGKITAIGKGGGAGIGGAPGSITKILFSETETITECGNIIIYGGDITAEGSDGAAGVGVAKLCDGGSVSIYPDAKIHAVSEGTAGIKAGTVTVYPKSAHDIIHVKQNDADVDGSPFTQTTEIGCLLGEGNVDVLPGILHHFTGDYVDNDDGTHSQKCVYCDEIDEECFAHTYEDGVCTLCRNVCSHDFTGKYVDNGNGTHSFKCDNCGTLLNTENHTYKYGKCTLCGFICNHTYDVDGVCTNCGFSNKYIDRSWDSTKKEVVSAEKILPTTASVITEDTTELAGGWYNFLENTENNNRIIVKGTADNPTNIVLLDGLKLDAKAGFEVAEGYVLNIYTQNDDTGEIVVSGDIYSAAIGGNYNVNAGTITVNGGKITAESYDGAGIGGGGYETKSGTVTVNGGTVTASAHGGAGIGGGFRSSGGTVTVNGGTVKATSTYGAGIGGGSRQSGDTITINGGIVTAILRRGRS